MNRTSNEQAALLRAEYEHRFAEVLFNATRYHRQADYVHSLFTVMIAGATFMAVRIPTSPATLDTSMGWLVLLILTGGLAFELHLVTSIMDALFMLNLNGARLAAIERRLNESVADETLTWDSAIIPLFFNAKNVRTKSWIRPAYLVATWATVLFGTALGILVLLCQVLLPQAAPYYGAMTLLLGGFHCYQWWLLQTSGLQAIRHRVSSVSGVWEAEIALDQRLARSREAPPQSRRSP
jgi:hypothetical protein